MELREVGDRLRILRRDRTQKEFSSLYGIPQGTLSKFEGGKLEPGLDFLAEVSKREGVSIDWILTGEPEDTSSKWMVQEPAAEYQPLSPSSRKLVQSVVEILRSGNKTVVQAFKANVRAYMEAIRAGCKDGKDGKSRGKKEDPKTGRRGIVKDL